jgi:prephenate dehydrogenase
MRLADRMTIAGVGLIGGSLAAAAREAGLVGEILGFGRTKANLETARTRGLIDRIVTDDAAAATADLIVLAAPVRTCGTLAARFAPHAKATAIVTDVGSVKGTLVDALEASWRDPARVVGAHPIAGSEESGAGAAKADLFRGRLCVLTPTPRTGPEALRTIRALWEGVGARVEEMSTAAHDAILARVSHLPHVLAYALVRAVADGRADGRRLLDYAGSGFLDATRIAASPAEVWRDIALANRGAIEEALGELRLALDDLAALIAAEDGAGLEQALDAAARARRAMGAKA